jgi:hypothetical protein
MKPLVVIAVMAVFAAGVLVRGSGHAGAPGKGARDGPRPLPVGVASAMGTEVRGRELIQLLGLSILPKESGYLGIIGVSAQKVKVHGGRWRCRARTTTC